MDKRTFGVDKEHIRNPDLLHKTCIKGATLVAAGGEGKAIVLPVMPEVQSHGEVLENKTQVLKLNIEKDKDMLYNHETNYRNPRDTYHVYFRYAINTLHLDIDANRNG